MNRANQQLLFQTTNQGLLNIRQSEINYYQSLMVAFGTQAALIGGFTYGVFTQNQINDGNGYASVDVLADVYWVCSAITIALSVHVILCTMLMQVLGPGLSLNGPVGSMARATEGMRIEQRQIIVAFILMMIMFAVSTVLSCWVVMSFEASTGCSVAFAIAACYWYKYCERIYLRFYWDHEDSGWNAKSGSFDDMNERDPSEDVAIGNKHLDPNFEGVTKSTKAARNKLNKPRGFMGFMFRGKETPTNNKRRKSRSSVNSEKSDDANSSGGRQNSTGSIPNRANLISKLLNPTNRERTHSETSSDPGTTGNALDGVPNPWAVTSAKRGVVMEGYLTKRGGGGSTQKFMDFGSEPWERRYFTLTNTCNMFIYKNRNEYRTDPKAPIYTRPLRMYEYYIVVHNMNSPSGKSSSIMLFDTPEEDSANPYRFQMTLILRENVNNPNFAGDIAESGSTTVVGHTGPSLNPIITGGFGGKTSKSSNSPMSTATSSTAAATHKQQMYRDHWVLRCDTEEELLQWVGIIGELCPSCFKSFD